MQFKKDPVIAVIGLGYVGLPLAIAFSEQYAVLGYDTNQERIDSLLSEKDWNSTVKSPLLLESGVVFSADKETLKKADVFIVTVPTPIDEFKQPDLEPLKKASAILGSVIKKGDLVIYESTVYPGATEEVCLPIIEEKSGLKFNVDFFAGYSPERISPNDEKHQLKDVVKVTSGSTLECAEYVDRLYSSIITAGTHLVSSIQVAEASKIIENTQRDLNIALVNELAIIFDRLGLDTEEILNAAATKWNFLPFKPGLVGGHCIGVDPYYLTRKAEESGYRPNVILAGRRVNDRMGQYVVGRVIKAMILRGLVVKGARMLIMGLAFKENCADIRNTKVIDMIEEAESFGIDVDVYDPRVRSEDAKNEYNIELLTQLKTSNYDAIVLAVAHDEFKVMAVEKIRSLGKPNSILFDTKYIFPAAEVDERL